MSRALSMTLKEGDQAVATTISHFTHKGAEGKQSQWVGDLVLVNSVRPHGVLGTVLHRGQGNPHTGAIGKATSLCAGTFRMATPDDPGYMATREQWMGHADREFARLRAESMAWAVIALLSLGALAMVALP